MNKSKMNKYFILFSLIYFLCLYHSVNAQNNKLNFVDSVVSIQMYQLIDDTKIYGETVDENDTSLIIARINSKRTSINKEKIKKQKQIKSIRTKNGYWFENSNNIMSIYSPYAFNLRKGEIFIRNNNLILNRFGYGVTNNISIYTGIDLFSVLDENNTFYLMTKYYFELNNNFHLSPSLLYIYDRGFYTTKDFGGPLITLSYGNKERNIGVSTGYNFFEINESRLPFYILNGKFRILNRIAFHSEIFLYANHTHLVYNYGFQYIMNKATLNIGFINSSWIFEDIPIGVPLLGIAFKI